MKKLINCDIMVDGRFYRSIHLPVETNLTWIDDKLVDVVDSDDIKNQVESRLPSLKSKNYNIYLA